MTLCTTNNKDAKVSLKDAVLRGLAEDGGLYIPRVIPEMSPDFFTRLPNLSLQEIGFEVAQQLIDIPDKELRTIIENSLTFDAPTIEVDKGIFSLELFHGPTLSFKDFGARFMAQLFRYFLKDASKELNILVATSGDTGSAVAYGFLNVPGIRVWVLYPKGKISHIQEKQIATIGQNVTALEVNGTFDDCQKLVKEAFRDQNLRRKIKLTSANSINIARLIPQSFYYFYAIGQVGSSKISVPSGNFGNVTAGLIAKKMGLDVPRFILSTNVNDVVPDYLKTGAFEPRPSITTLSNAMDVGNPSNFSRIQALYNGDIEKIRHDMVGAHFSDEETLNAIERVYKSTGYLLDPHGAVAYLGLQKHGGKGIFLATAHPAKFDEAIHQCLDIDIPVPERLQKCLKLKKQSIEIDTDYDSLVRLLMR